ncbi:MAG: hypothetical protein NC033_02780 [Clostridiales bacterium]|nr:hypothetical protein [Clostridiales bacterium]
MKKINFALISDVIFFALCAFVLCFTGVRFYTRNALTALIVAVGTAAACGLIAFYVLLAKRKKRLILSLSESEKKSLSLHLSVCGEEYLLNLFENALDGTYVRGKRLQDNENVYFFNFKMSPLSSDDIAQIIRVNNKKRKHIYCCEISPAALSLSEDFSIDVVTVAEIYALLKDKNLLPEKYALGNVKKPNVIKRIKKRFNRKLCPALFFSGITLLFFSFFTFYPLYYVIFGGLLTALSAVSVLISQPSR